MTKDNNSGSVLRCPWGEADNDLMRKYHDTEWGKPCFDGRKLLEMLILDGAQAGLSWSCILNKRENYRAAFDNFDAEKIAAYGETKVHALLQNKGIVRNRLKIQAAITNAELTLKLGSLSDFIWNYTNGEPIVNHWQRQEEMPATSPLSDRISRDMRKMGFKFVGSIIIYSFLQSAGVVNDHVEWCVFK
jgi:DNA-3-methyladenine glycosylase I